MRDLFLELVSIATGIFAAILAVRYRRAKNSLSSAKEEIVKKEVEVQEAKDEAEAEVFIVRKAMDTTSRIDEDKAVASEMLQTLSSIVTEKEVHDDTEGTDASRLPEERPCEERIRKVADEKVIRLASRIDCARKRSGRNDGLHIE